MAFDVELHLSAQALEAETQHVHTVWLSAAIAHMLHQTNAARGACMKMQSLLTRYAKH